MLAKYDKASQEHIAAIEKYMHSRYQHNRKKAVKQMNSIFQRCGDFLVRQNVESPWEIDMNRIYRLNNEELVASITNFNTEECGILVVKNGENGYKRFIKNQTISEYLKFD